MTKERCPKFPESAVKFIVGKLDYTYPTYVTSTSGEADSDRAIYFEEGAQALAIDDEARANLIYMRLMLSGEIAFIMSVYEEQAEHFKNH